MRYRVSTKGSIMHPKGGDLLKPGTIVEDGLFTADQIREHTRSGYLVQLGMPSAQERPLTGREDVPPLPMMDDEAKKRKADADALVVGAGSPPETKKTPAGQVPAEHVSSWNLDPATLQDKSLEQLNAMISERDGTIGRIENTGEAIQILSMDFKPGT